MLKSINQLTKKTEFMKNANFILRMVLPMVQMLLSGVLQSLKDITPEHFDKVIDFVDKNVIGKLVGIISDDDKDNKAQLQDWWREQRSVLLYVSLGAVAGEGKVLVEERLPEGSAVGLILSRQLEELEQTLTILQSSTLKGQDLENEILAKAKLLSESR